MAVHMVEPTMIPRARRRLFATAIIGGALVAGTGQLGGCAWQRAPQCSSYELFPFGDDRFEPFENPPRNRIGCLPFPGPFTLFARADPAALGTHSYSGELPAGGEPEVSRGILYTRRAGFLDICHVRYAADLVAYAAPRIEHALRREWSCVPIRTRGPSVFNVTLDYPDTWWTMTDAERDELVPELSQRLAQRLSLIITDWHEIITWYGYKSTFFISERGSAFTYDDTVSHIVGVLVAETALGAGGSYDDQVTIALDRVLEELGAVDPETFEGALRAVEGIWWENGQSLKRLVELGIDKPIEPWLVPGLCEDADMHPTPIGTPLLRDVRGHDFSSLTDVVIEPRILESWIILSELRDADDGTVLVSRDFPVLISKIRKAVDQHGR